MIPVNSLLVMEFVWIECVWDFSFSEEAFFLQIGLGGLMKELLEFTRLVENHLVSDPFRVLVIDLGLGHIMHFPPWNDAV